MSNMFSTVMGLRPRGASTPHKVEIAKVGGKETATETDTDACVHLKVYARN